MTRKENRAKRPRYEDMTSEKIAELRVAKERKAENQRFVKYMQEHPEPKEEPKQDIAQLVIQNGLRSQLPEDYMSTEQKEERALIQEIQWTFKPWESTYEADKLKKQAEDKLAKRNLEENLNAQFNKESLRLTGKELSQNYH